VDEPIVSPDGKHTWNGSTWVPLVQNDVGAIIQSAQHSSNQIPYVIAPQSPIILQPQTNSNSTIILIIAICSVPLLVILSGVLYVWASDLAGEGISVTMEEFEVTSPTIFGDATACNDATIIESGEYISCTLKLNRDAEIEIKLRLESENPTVHLYTMTNINFDKFKDGADFLYIEELSGENIYSADYNGQIAEGNYVVVVWNHN